MASALTSVVTVAGCAALALFIAAYAALAPWYRSPAGRALMGMSAGFFLVVLTLMLRHPFGLSTQNSQFFSWLQAAARTVALIGTVWIISVLARAQARRGYFDPDRERMRGKGRGR